MTKLQQIDFQERKTDLKLIIIMGVLAFILSVVGTMFFTGTFSRNNEQTSIDEIAQQADGEANKNKTSQTMKANVANQTEPNKNDTSYTDSEKDIDQADPYNLELAYKDSEITSKSESKNTKETETKYEQLAKVYSSMKLENAATVMCELEPKFTERILSKMNDRVAGKIMSAIADKDPSYAAKVSKLLVSADKM